MYITCVYLNKDVFDFDFDAPVNILLNGKSQSVNNPNEGGPLNDRMEEKPEDFHTLILKQELKKYKEENCNLIATIDFLHNENQKLEEEILKLKNQHSQKCVQCYPPLGNSKMQENQWKTVRNKNRNKSGSHHFSLNCENSFEILSSDTSSDEQPSEIDKVQHSKNNSKRKNIIRNNNKDCPSEVSQCKTQSPKVIILADSHGKLLCNLIHQRATANICSFVRSGAKFNKVTEEAQQLSKDLTKKDHLLVIAGTNDVENTSVEQLINDVQNLIENSKHTNLTIATLPMRHDKPELDLKISVINAKLEKMENLDTNVNIIPFHLLPRHLYTVHGMHFNMKGKIRLAEMVVKKLLRNETPPPQRRPLSTIIKQAGINVIEEDMNKVINQFRNDPSVAFAHSISGDLEHERNMTAGVAVVFRKQFGRPKKSDFKNEKLMCQKVEGGASIYSLVTKPSYNGKPNTGDYNSAFAQLTQDFKSNGLKMLFCSPIGCIRDQIQLQLFAENIINFHRETGAPVCVVSFNENSRRLLRNGLSHSEFITKLRASIEEKLKELSLNAEVSGTPAQSLSVSTDITPSSSTSNVDCQKNFSASKIVNYT
jgi:hypothetical protein